ncbi:unnamed protein product [Ectocarpus fasciculatus]
MIPSHDQVRYPQANLHADVDIHVDCTCRQDTRVFLLLDQHTLPQSGMLNLLPSRPCMNAPIHANIFHFRPFDRMQTAVALEPPEFTT